MRLPNPMGIDSPRPISNNLTKPERLFLPLGPLAGNNIFVFDVVDALLRRGDSESDPDGGS